MNNEIKEYIDKAVEIVHKQYEKSSSESQKGTDSSNPAERIGENLANFVEKLGGQVREDDSIVLKADGLMEKRQGTEEFSIVLVPEMTRERKNFIIAHELGHLFLHWNLIGDPAAWREASGDSCFENGEDYKEQQANAFAEAFLMPQEEYFKALGRSSVADKINIEKVAKQFGVSRDIAEHRGRELGYLV